MLSVYTVWTACENDLADLPNLYTTDDAKMEVIQEVEILYSDSALVRVQIEAPLLHRYDELEQPRNEFPEGVLVKFFDANRRVSSQLTAKYAIQYDNQKEITVQDSVVLTSAGGKKLETEQLIWDERDERIYSTKWVRVSRPGEIVTGYGFESDQEFDEWKINSITGRILTPTQ